MFFFILRLPPRSTRNDTPCPDTTLFRSPPGRAGVMCFAVPPAMSRLRGLLSAGALIGAVAVLCLAGAAAAEEPMVFDVLRDGSKIGEHRVLFEREDGTLKVSVETDI